MARTSKLPNAPLRIEKVNGAALGIRTFDVDNGYPQRMNNIYNATSTAKKAAALCARYIVGKGFNNIEFYNAIIGRQGNKTVTPDKLLRKLAHDKSRHRGFAVHVNYNALYEKDTIKFVPWEHTRLGVDENGNLNGTIGVNDNWYTDAKGGQRRKKEDIDFIDLYDPRPEVIDQQVKAAGGWAKYKGQIYWYSEEDGYPLATIDPNLEDCEAERASSSTRKNNVTNNFQMKKIYVVKGKSETNDQQDEETAASIRSFMGPDGNSVQVVFSEDEEGKDVPEVINIKTELDDKIFAYTDQVTRAYIYGAFNQPAILHSDYLSTNGYNEGQLPQSQDYYNSLTDPDRILFEEVFRELFTGFKDNINKDDDYTIAPLDVIGADISIEEEDTRPLIEVIGIGGMQALQAIIADPNLNADQKKDFLVIAFGLTEEDAEKLSGSGETETESA